MGVCVASGTGTEWICDASGTGTGWGFMVLV